MTQLLEDLALITAKTLEHYNERAAEFWEDTRDHDVKENIEALLRHIRRCHRCTFSISAAALGVTWHRFAL